jgi:protein disulfide-isomerase
MVKKIRTSLNSISFFAILFLLASNLGCASAASQEKSIHWEKSYAVAIKKAEETKKPIFLYFSGSDWCSFCMKFDKEILASEDFIDQVGSIFIFCQVDFPINTIQEPALARQNEELKSTHNVRGFPTIVLLDASSKPFASLSYRPGGGDAYAKYVLSYYQRHKQYTEEMKTLDHKPMATLEKCFQYAKEHQDTNAQKKIISTALAQEPSPYFLKEHYRILLNEKKFNTPIAKLTRELILSSDPKNEKHLRMEVAVLDFEALEKNSAPSANVEAIVKPLKDYLAEFGADDEKNRWKIEIMISQIYSNKNQTTDALNFAMASQSHAPAAYRLDIAKNIDRIQNKNEAIVNADESREEK